MAGDTSRGGQTGRTGIHHSLFLKLNSQCCYDTSFSYKKDYKNYIYFTQKWQYVTNAKEYGAD